MIWAVDTSVLVAALVTAHPRHLACRTWLLRTVPEQSVELIACAHLLAESFSVLTRLPLNPAIRPPDAEVLITRELIPRCRMIDITRADQLAAMSLVIATGRSGGAIHDALHVSVARRAGATRLWTLNRKDFVPLWDKTHIAEPGQS